MRNVSPVRPIIAAVVLTWAALFAAPGPARAQAGRPPNIVFILADDLGINDLGCYGRKDQPTPHLDRLARQGARFTTAYAAQSVCSPSRAALLTGQAPARLHLTTFLPGRPDAPAQLLRQPEINQQLPANVRTLAEMLRADGYRSACVGKWHLGGKGALPTDRGFDVYYPGQALTKPSATEGGKGEYELTAQAEKFIEAGKDRPFFLYLAHHCPHVVLNAKPELIEKHRNAFNPIYAAMLETLDDSVGRLLARLDALGLRENTVVIFTSDNGGLHVAETPHTPATYNHPYRAGKGFCYEGGLRVPLLVRWPGKVRPGVTIDTPVIGTDWTPTLLDVCGVKTDEKFDGVSLRGLLLKGEALPPRALYWHEAHYTNQGGQPAGAIREGPWKLVEHYEDGRCELFHLGRDAGEQTDVSAREPARVADLRGKLEKWRRDVGAQENKANPQFNPHLWRRLYQEKDASRIGPAEKAATLGARWQPWRDLMNQVVAARGKEPAAAGAGVVILHARDARVHGSKLRYEKEPHKDTLGYWVQKDDWAEWQFTLPAPGKFEVQILQGCAGKAGSEIEVEVGGQKVRARVEGTGHFQRFVPRTIGIVDLKEAGPQRLSVRALRKAGGAVMDLRRVVLRAAP